MNESIWQIVANRKHQTQTKVQEYEKVKITNLQIVNIKLLTQKKLQTQFKVLDTKVHPWTMIPNAKI
jgi:hypothetical protein